MILDEQRKANLHIKYDRIDKNLKERLDALVACGEGAESPQSLTLIKILKTKIKANSLAKELLDLGISPEEIEALTG